MLKDKPRKMSGIIVSTIFFFFNFDFGGGAIQRSALRFVRSWLLKAIKVIRLLAMILSELNPNSIKEMHIPNRKYEKDWQCRRRVSDISKSGHDYVTNQ
jgi:hypothetical protein